VIARRDTATTPLRNGAHVRLARQGLLGRLVGEMSNLRRAVGVAWAGSLLSTYTLDSTRVDHVLARDLYRNTRDAYKLGAAFAKPIVNTTAGFMGAPSFTHDDPEAQKELEAAVARWRGKLLEINRDALRDGDCYVRVGRRVDRFAAPGADPSEQIDLFTVPPEWCEPRFAPLSREWEKFTIHHPVEVVREHRDGSKEVLTGVVDEVITPDEVAFVVKPEETRPEIRALERAPVTNEWGFIPIVHFKNEAEESSLFGTSDLEPVEPFLKAYHDVALHAIQGSRLFSRPKVKFKLKDVKSFLRNNFTDAQLASGAVNFAGKELFLLAEGDDAEFISADPGLAGIVQLLEVIFLCVVDVSETPEFAFGAGVQSSHGSVAEQQVPLSRKIERKRGQFSAAYAELAALYLSVLGPPPRRRDGARQPPGRGRLGRPLGQGRGQHRDRDPHDRRGADDGAQDGADRPAVGLGAHAHPDPDHAALGRAGLRRHRQEARRGRAPLAQAGRHRDRRRQRAGPHRRRRQAPGPAARPQLDRQDRRRADHVAAPHRAR
jgi:hypothetical protein